MTETTQDLLTDFDTPIVRYSTFWQRFFATFIDGLVLAPFAFIDIYNETTWKSYTILAASFLITLCYKPFFENKFGATIGKMALSLTIVNTDYQRAEIKNILLRNIIDIVDRVVVGFVTLLTFINVGFEDVNSLAGYTKLSNAEAGGEWVTMLTAALILIDAICLIVDERRQALHDKIGSTLVIQKIKEIT
jgi:uncharacterized RDD family membrane protein YckC